MQAGESGDEGQEALPEAGGARNLEQHHPLVAAGHMAHETRPAQDVL